MPPRTEQYFFDHLGYKGAEAEWRAYDALVRTLSPDWMLFSSVVVRRPGRSNVVREADIVLVHPKFGIVIGEVKSGDAELDRIREADGQMEKFRSLLKDRLDYHRILSADEFSRIRSFVFCPMATRRPRLSEIRSSINENQVLVAEDLANLPKAIEQTICGGVEPEGLQLGGVKVNEMANFLDWRLREDHQDLTLSRARAISGDQKIEGQVANLVSLDRNRRVLVEGRAGAGKTWLAAEWVKKASSEGKRVLLTCYNEALSEVLQKEMDGLPNVTVAPFLRHLEAQAGRGRTEASPGEDLSDHWLEMMVEVAGLDEPKLGRFDLIVVDEAQDFEPDWINEVMPMLLADESGRILMVGDLRQNVRGIDHGYLEQDNGWARAELTKNLRSPAPIAAFAARFGGAPPQEHDAMAARVDIIEVKDGAAFLLAVEEIVSEISKRHQDDTWVLTTSEASRDLLRAEVVSRKMVPWRFKQDGIVCVTAAKVKGLETPNIVLAIYGPPDSEDDLDQVIYTASTRATEKLTVITTPSAARSIRGTGPVDWVNVL